MAHSSESTPKGKKVASTSPESKKDLKDKHSGKADSAKKLAKKASRKAEEKVKAEKPGKTSGKKKGVKEPAKNPSILSPEQRNRMISEAAYYRAEHRRFSGGTAHDDWVEAEAEIERMLSGDSR